MKATRVRDLLLVWAVVTVAGWAGLSTWMSMGNASPPLTWLAAVALLLFAVVVWVTGVPVRRWTRGDRRRPLDPLRAARTAVLAKATSHAGAMVAGWYVAQALAVGLPALAALRPREVVALGSAGAAVVLAVVGLVVERNCRIPPDDDEPPRGAALS